MRTHTPPGPPEAQPGPPEAQPGSSDDESQSTILEEQTPQPLPPNRGPLLKAVQEGNHWKVRYLVRQGVPLNAHAPATGPSVLVTCLRMPDAKPRYLMFKWLLELGADVLAVDPDTGRDVLLWAVYLNRTKEVGLILDTEEVVDMDMLRKDRDGYVSLHYAVMHNNVRLVQKLTSILKRYGLTVDVPDSTGFTPYLQAVRCRYETCAKILLEQGGADRGVRDTAVFNSDLGWRHIGERSKCEKAKRINDKRAGVYKSMGRLPQLKAAQFNSYKVQVVHTKMEHGLLGSLNRDNTQIRLSNNFHLPPLRQSILSPSENRDPVSHSAPDKLIASVSNFKTDATTDVPAHIKKCLSPITPAREEDNSTRTFNILMDIYAQQQSPGYCRPAPRTGDPDSWKTSTSPEFEDDDNFGFAALRGISKFALMMRRKRSRVNKGKGGLGLILGIPKAQPSPGRSKNVSPALTDSQAVSTQVTDGSQASDGDTS